MHGQGGGEDQQGHALAADGPGRAGATDVAMLVDLAAGAALRGELGADRRLATTAQTVQLLAPLPALDELVARAVTPATDGRRGTAGVELAANGAALGHAVVAFAVLGGGLPPVPWEQPARAAEDIVTRSEAALDETECAALALVRAAGPVSWSEALLRGACTRVGPSTVLQPSPLMANRAGGVQGGVLVGFAVLAATGPAGQLDAVHVNFAAPASISSSAAAEIRASVTTLRRGRRSQLLRVDLHQDDVLVAAATVTLRRI